MKYLLTCLWLAVAVASSSQLQIVQPVVSEFQFSPDLLKRVGVISSYENYNVIVEIEVTGTEGVCLLLKSPLLNLKKGYNDIGQFKAAFDISYSENSSARFIRTHNALPSGLFSLCYSIRSIGEGAVSLKECQEIKSERDMILDLVFPNNHDTIIVDRPILSWIHSSPFSDLINGQSFNLRLVEINSGQSSEQAIAENTPIIYLTNIRSHSVSFPVTVEPLKKGGHYSWNVDFVDQGTVKVRTETWDFYIETDLTEAPLKYVVLGRNVTPDIYRVVDKRVYFSLNESLIDASRLQVQIYDSKGKSLVAENQSEVSNEVISVGVNQFEFDTSPFKLKKGFYTMRVTNARNDKYVLMLDVQ